MARTYISVGGEHSLREHIQDNWEAKKHAVPEETDDQLQRGQRQNSTADFADE